jgi:hypothetical protein
MAKSNAVLYTVKVFNERGIRTLEGSFQNLGKNDCTFTYKKPKSKNFASRVIPISDVVAFSGGVGKPSMISFLDKMVLSKIYKGAVETGESFIKVTQDDGTIINVRSGANVEVIADTVDAPSGDAVKKKKKSGGKKSEKKAEKKSDKK